EAASVEKDQSDRSEKEAALADLKDQLAKAEADKVRLSQEIESLLNQYQMKDQEVKAKQDESYRANQEMNQANQRLMQATARKESLEDLDRDHAGFYQGVKAALDLSDKIQGVHGAVAQLLRVPDTYTGAVE